jgi:methylase of polypeptide subunit release factors
VLAGPLTPNEESLADLRAALGAAEFTVERVEATFETHGLSARLADIALHLRRLADVNAFSTLARLFLLGAPVDPDRASAALAPLTLERLAGLGLVELDPKGVRATVRLVPHGDLYVASDLQHEGSPETPSNYVAGIQAPSVTLAKLAVRRGVSAALDLGTGCGIQALLAGRHSDRVIATDVNQRALNFTAFNAALNGIENLEFREGDGFEPVAGLRFDLIVSNPPYVISPDTDFAYRDSGLAGDTLCRELVRRLPEHLNEDGFAHILVSWAHPPGEWAEPLRTWVAGSGCDAWLLHYKSEDPITHSSTWLRPLAEQDVPAYERALDRWLAYLESLGIEEIGYGAVVLRRRRGRNWVHLDELPSGRLQPASEHTLRVFAAQDFLANTDERALLDARFVLADAHRLEQTLVHRDGAYVVESQTLELDEGLGFQAGLDRHTAALLPHFGPHRPLHEVLTLAASSLELTESEREQFTTAGLPVVRRLLELGFLRVPCS